MDVTQLRTLLHVAELGSLSKASGRLRIAQSALSRQIRLLEEELGVRLFERHGRGMVITEPGRTALRHAKRILADIDELRASASGPTATLTGHVAIGLPPTIADLLSVPLIAAFRGTHPKVQVQLTSAYTGHLLDGLHRGEIDVAVLYDPRATRFLRSEPLMLEPLFLIGSAEAGLHGQTPISFATLADEQLLPPSTRHGLRNVLEQFTADAGIALDVPIEIDSYQALKEPVRHGYGRTVLTLAPMHAEIAAGLLTAAPLAAPTPTRRLVLAYPSDRPAARAAVFAGDAMKAIMRAAVDRGTWAGTMLDKP